MLITKIFHISECLRKHLVNFSKKVLPTPVVKKVIRLAVERTLQGSKLTKPLESRRTRALVRRPRKNLTNSNANDQKEKSKLRVCGPKYKCQTPGCGRSYVYKSNLKKHQRYECQVAPRFMCPYCLLRMAASGNMRRHIKCMHKGLEIRVVKVNNKDLSTQE